jgi:hypothetical protein
MMLKRQTGITGATVAGEANIQGGVYDRLSSTKTFTGVYAKRFEGGPGGGRINGDTINSRHHGYVPSEPSERKKELAAAAQRRPASFVQAERAGVAGERPNILLLPCERSGRE